VLAHNTPAAFIHVSNCVTLRTDLVLLLDKIEFAYDRSWKSRRRSRIRNGQKVELYLLNTSEMMYMPSIDGRKGVNVIGPNLSHSDSIDSS